MRSLLYVTLAVLVLLPPSARAMPKIGCYFDDAATTNCLPAVDTFPHSVSVYLVVTECSPEEVVNGWEGALAVSPALLVVGQSIEGQAVNFRSPPEFIVGLAAGLPQGQQVLLATFSVVAMGPGEIYWKGLGVSVPDSLPALTVGNERDIVIPEYSYGGRELPVATIGTIECPEVHQAISDAGVYQLAPLGHEQYVTILGAQPAIDPTGKASGIGAPEDVGARVSVLDVQREAVAFDYRVCSGRRVGAIRLLCETYEVFWGFPADTINVWLAGYDVPGEIVYRPPLVATDGSEFTIGSEWIINARRLDGGYIVGPAYFIGGVAPAGVKSSSGAAQERFLDGYTMQELLEASDAVVDVSVIDHSRGISRFRALRVIKGEVAEEFSVEGISNNCWARIYRYSGARLRLYITGGPNGMTLTDPDLGVLVY